MFLYEKDNKLIGIFDDPKQLPAKDEADIDFVLWKDETDGKVHCKIGDQEISG